MPKRYEDKILEENFGKETMERVRREVEEQKRRFLKTSDIHTNARTEEFKGFSEEVIEDWREIVGRCG